jgi:hypothetical protein
VSIISFRREAPSGVGRHREAVAEGAGDRQAEAGLGCCNAQIRPGGDAEPAADGDPLDLCDDRLAHPGDPARALVVVALVREAVLGAAKFRELADVAAGDERLAARALEHEDPYRVVRVDLLADFVEPLVHAPGHGVARLGAVEGDGDDRAVARDEDLARCRSRVLHG